ncbi:MAG: biotin--[acetyl-CoA-carboxylase] ligase [Ruminococcaceae bacterium]|nr:biotin--[acetyl-CoA-carboxylase] ligase [Oscillospiraceae bacterium]
MKKEILTLLPPDYTWGESIYYLESVDSTSNYAKILAKSGAPEGTAVIARCQAGGRGRMGRSFHSPEGGLYLTVILRPKCKAQELMHLTCGAGVATGNAIFAVTGIRPGLKWINDLVIGAKKVGGILTEMSLTPDGFVDYALIGIGINCKDTIPPELIEIATALDREAGEEISVATLAAALLRELHTLSCTIFSEKEALLDRYRTFCITIGKEVLLIRGEEKRQAFALDITDDGGLLVKFPDGTQDIISSGEASVRGLFGYSS